MLAEGAGGASVVGAGAAFAGPAGAAQVGAAGAQQLAAGAQQLAWGAQHADLLKQQRACAACELKRRAAEQTAAAKATLYMAILLTNCGGPIESRIPARSDRLEHCKRRLREITTSELSA